MGLEALSRGAKSVTFVDMNRLACQCIKDNVKLLNVEEKIDLLCMSANKAIEWLIRKEKTFDLIYIDPPYNKEFLPSLLEQIGASSLLKNGGRIFAEESDRATVEVKGLHLIEKRKYGNSILLEYSIA